MATQEISRKSVIIGIFLIIAGIIIIFDNFNILPGIPGYVFSWQAMLVLIGLFIIVTSHNRTPGFFMIGIGLYFLLPQILGIPKPGFHMLLPLILILSGVAILFHRKHKPCDFKKRFIKEDVNMDFIDETVVFGGGEKIVNTKNFQGGKLTAIFGGLEMNFLNCELAEGKNVIEMVAVFGGCSLIVPPDWNVKVEVTSLFGGFSQKNYYSGSAVIDSTKELYIKGVVIFGGGEIKYHK